MRFICRSPFRSRPGTASIPVGRDYFHANPPSGFKLRRPPNTILYTGSRTWLLLSMAPTVEIVASGFRHDHLTDRSEKRRISHANLSHIVDAGTGGFLRARLRTLECRPRSRQPQRPMATQAAQQANDQMMQAAQQANQTMMQNAQQAAQNTPPVLSVFRGQTQILGEIRQVFLGCDVETERLDPRSGDLLHDGRLDADGGSQPDTPVRLRLIRRPRCKPLPSRHTEGAAGSPRLSTR